MEFNHMTIKALTRSVMAIVMFVVITNFYPPQPQNMSASDNTPQAVDVQVTKDRKFSKEFDALVTLLPHNVLHSMSTSIIKEVNCMALNNYYEASTQGIDGMQAVSQVVLNRVDEQGFPGTACGVIYQKNKVMCQFSWTCQRTLPKLDTSSEAWKNAVHVAKEMYVDGHVATGLEDALFYHATYVKPHWKKLVRVKTIGQHVFYKKT